MSGQYRDDPTEFYAPSEAELKARSRRNVAIALGLVAFMIGSFLIMITRSGAFAEPGADNSYRDEIVAKSGQQEGTN